MWPHKFENIYQHLWSQSTVSRNYSLSETKSHCVEFGFHASLWHSSLQLRSSCLAPWRIHLFSGNCLSKVASITHLSNHSHKLSLSKSIQVMSVQLSANQYRKNQRLQLQKVSFQRSILKSLVVPNLNQQIQRSLSCIGWSFANVLGAQIASK